MESANGHPADVESVIRPTLLSNAVPGNRDGFADVFDCVALYMRSGQPFPPELAEWGAKRFEGVARVLRDPRDSRFHGLPAALGLVEHAKRGNKPESDADRKLKASLAWECHYERRREGCKKSDAPARVAQARNAALDRFARDHVTSHARAAALTITETLVAQVWKRRRHYAPDIPE
jgi:hypothetical protein